MNNCCNNVTHVSHKIMTYYRCKNVSWWWYHGDYVWSTPCGPGAGAIPLPSLSLYFLLPYLL